MNLTLNFGQLPNWLSAALIGAYIASLLGGRFPVVPGTKPSVPVEVCEQLCDRQVRKYGPHECECAPTVREP